MRLPAVVIAILLCVVTGIGAGAATDRQSTTSTASSPSLNTYVGTTPAPSELLQFLGAPSGTTAELIEWSLVFGSDSQYRLRAAYGKTMPNYPGIQRERKEVDRQGTVASVRGTKSNPAAFVIDLGGLAFVQVGPSILHLLTADRSLMIGNGSASFSLNRSSAAEPPRDPSLPPSGGEGSYTIDPVSTGPAVYGTFEGRTPCQRVALAMGRTVDPGCARLKWRLTLLQDPATQKPTTFRLEGSMFRADKQTGPWTISDRGVITLEDPNHTTLVSLLKVEDDALMFMDRANRLLVGNASFSYTLERRKRP